MTQILFFHDSSFFSKSPFYYGTDKRTKRRTNGQMDT